MSEEKAQDLFGLNAEENEDNTSSEDEEQKDNSQFSRRKPVVQSGDLLDIGNEKDDDDLSDSESESEGSANEDEDEDGNDDLGLSDYEQEQDQDQDDENQNDNQNKKKKKVKPLTKEELEKYREAEKKSGVCYLSRIPRFMQPKKVKELLGRYAEVGRVFLVPEDPKITARRKKERNIRKTNYVEGWVEFKDKKQAKALAEYLNTRQIGGKRKHFFYYDIWNIKYLPKFKWRHLIERMAYERKAREQRLQAEMAQAARENKAYLQNVEKAKMVQAMQEKRKKRKQATNDEEQPEEEEHVKIRRTFKQREKVDREVDPTKQDGREALSRVDDSVKSVLGKVLS